MTCFEMCYHAGWISVRGLGPKQRVQHCRDSAKFSLCASDCRPFANAASDSATGESVCDEEIILCNRLYR